jgi:hypothetical protein
MPKPSWIDVLALAAVIVVAVVLRQCGQIIPAWRPWDFVPPENAFIVVARNVRRVLETLTPSIFGFAVVGFSRVLRQPRPRRILQFRQPGVAACAAIVAALAAGTVNTAVWMVRWFEFGEQWLTPSAGMVINLAARHVSSCVLAAWAFLACGGLWTPGRNWVNRLGCALGILLLVNSVLEWLP